MTDRDVLAQLERRAQEMDGADSLAAYRDRFAIPDDTLLYMDGNSLGRMPKAASDLMHSVLDEQWSGRLIRAWGETWYDAPTRIGDKLGQLVGASPGEVLLSDSTSVNIFKLVQAALAARPGRKDILSDELNFPTDLYIIQGAAKMLGSGHKLELLSSANGISVSIDEYAERLSSSTALVTFSTPTFKSGFLHDVPRMTAMAHEAGALVLWDFSHAVGAVPLALDQWGVDLAVGCTYKYLNGGPGSPAFLYVRQELQSELLGQPWGWWGHREPFAFDLDFAPDESIRRFLVGTPPVLSSLAVEPGLDMALEAGMENIRRKAFDLGEYFLQLFDSMLEPIGYTLGSPRSPEQRGSHISIRHPEGFRISQALTAEERVIPDFREPDNIRLGFAPLYTRFGDLYEAALRLQRVVVDRTYTKYSTERTTVR